jgi:hypothetical protein
MFYFSRSENIQERKEHGHTIIIKHLNDKVSVLRLVIYHRILAIFFSVLQFAVVEITYVSIQTQPGDWAWRSLSQWGDTEQSRLESTN